MGKWSRKLNSTFYSLQETQLFRANTDSKSKVGRQSFKQITPLKKAGMVILISDDKNFRLKNVIRNRGPLQSSDTYIRKKSHS